jgi:hypothetical protein
MSPSSIAISAATSPQPGTPVPPPQTKVSASALTTHPFLGMLGVFLGAGIATLNARLPSVGLPDLRGALGFGVDERLRTLFANARRRFVAAFFGPGRGTGSLFGPATSAGKETGRNTLLPRWLCSAGVVHCLIPDTRGVSQTIFGQLPTPFKGGLAFKVRMMPGGYRT